MESTYAFVGDQTVGAMVEARMEAAGCSRAESVAEADTVITYYTTQTSLEDAYFDESGLIQSACPGTLLIDLSSSTPSFARELNAVAVVSDLVSVEAPLIVLDLSLPDAFAKKDNLACLVGGEEDAVQRALPVVEALAGDVQDTGGPGSAQLARAAYTLQTTAQVISAIEADALYRVVRRSSAVPGRGVGRVGAATPVAEQVLAAVETGSFAGTYTVEMLMSELSAALTAADDVDLILPQGEACLHLLELLAVIGGTGKAPSALSLVYGDESACAAEGLDWTRAEQTYGDASDDLGFSEYDDVEDGCGCGHDHSGDDPYSGYSIYPGYSAN